MKQKAMVVENVSCSLFFKLNKNKTTKKILKIVIERELHRATL